MPNILKGKSRWIGGLFLAALLPAADAASPATPGMINYVEGQVTLEGQTLTTKSVGSVDLEPNQVLSSDHGKAEILLTPGVFLRIGNNSAVRMISPELTDTQVELLNGEAMVEVTQLLKGNAITVVDHGATTLLEKTGLYDFKAAPPQTAVYDGKAEVSMDGRKITLKKGKEIDLLGQSKPQHFDTKAPESLFAWSNLRSEYLAEASYGSANTLAVNGGWYGPGWYWNPYWYMYSFMPDGFLYSPFGWGFYSPGVLWGGFGGYGYGGFHRGYGYAGGRGFRGGAMGHPAFHGTPRGGFAGGGFHGGGGGFHGGGGGFHGGGGGFHGGGGGGRGR